MTLETYKPQELLDLVDEKRGMVDRRIFSDKAIYHLELEQIFARAWNFMAHDSQIPNPGDFFMNYIGEDRVICVRDNDGNPQVLVNSCRHRGNAVCRAEEGHATSFMCTYHGWTYDLKGSLVGVPGFKEVYHEELDRESWGLIKAAQVDTYHGFIFANMDPEAPSLDEYLGDAGRLSIDMIALKGNMRVVQGVQKYILGCNWKFAADNICDFYHVPVTHASILMNRSFAALPRGTPSGKGMDKPQWTWLGPYGHALTGGVVPEPRRGKKNKPKDRRPERWRENPAAKEALGEAIHSFGNSVVFPSLLIGGQQAVFRLPKGAHKTESWWFNFVDKDLPAEQGLDILRNTGELAGPAGLLEQDDGENLEWSTLGAQSHAGRRYPFHYGMGLGRGAVIEAEGGPPRIESSVSEVGQLWLYRSWAHWMAAESWDDLKANHPTLEEGYV